MVRRPHAILHCCLVLTVACAALFTNLPAAARDDSPPPEPKPRPGQPTVGPVVTPFATRPLRDLPRLSVERPAGPVREVNPRRGTSAAAQPAASVQERIDPLLARKIPASRQADAFTTPLLNFAGQGFTGVTPPDPVGDVGPDHYVQMVNNTNSSLVTIFDKTDVIVAGPTMLSELAGGEGVCVDGWGDPIVLYDSLADRWLLSEFADSDESYLCVYISQTPDPTGAYYAYAYMTPEFPDYPKYAVWPDAYFVTTNESLPTVYALPRVEMLGGAPGQYQRFSADPLSGFGFQALTPADLDGPPPAAGEPGLFARQRDTEVHGPPGADSDYIELFALTIDWDTPANSSLDQLPSVPVAEFSSDLCGLFSFECFPQPNNVQLDPLREVIMWRFQYRNFGAYETLVGNFVTDVDGNDHGGVRWFELRKPQGAADWELYQEGTVALDAADRWMGAIAMDKDGNIALGYNVVSTSIFASLRYVGRLASDPLGVMSQPESSIAAGTTAGTSKRYGDYNAMSVDPVDGCTFWFTGEYNASSDWRTRIAAMRFESCGQPGFTLQVTPWEQVVWTTAVAVTATFTVTVEQLNGFDQPVTLAAVGNPGVAEIAPNPVVTSSSQLTITGVAPGAYAFAVVGSSTLTPTVVHTATVALTVLAADAFLVPIFNDGE